MCLRSLECSLVGGSEGGHSSLNWMKVRHLAQWQGLLGGSGRHADGKRPAWCVWDLPLLGQEGLAGWHHGGGAASETRLNRQLLKVQTLRIKKNKFAVHIGCIKGRIWIRWFAMIWFYLVIPRCDNQLLLIFSQSGLLTLTLQREIDQM